MRGTGSEIKDNEDKENEYEKQKKRKRVEDNKTMTTSKQSAT